MSVSISITQRVLAKRQIIGPHYRNLHRVSHSVEPGWDSRTCVSNKIPGDTDAAGFQTKLGEPHSPRVTTVLDIQVCWEGIGSYKCQRFHFHSQSKAWSSRTGVLPWIDVSKPQRTGEASSAAGDGWQWCGEGGKMTIERRNLLTPFPNTTLY